MYTNSFSPMSAYNHYNHFYATSTNTSYSSAKSTQFYRPISFPFYRVASLEAAKTSAFGLASLVRTAKHVTDAAQQFYNKNSSVMNQRQTTSSDPTSVKATAKNEASLQDYQIQVNHVAQAQKNTGQALFTNTATSLQSGTHQFSITLGSKTTNVSVNIMSSDTNEQALNKVKQAINSSKSGVNASVIRDTETGTVRLELQSAKTGTDNAFTISDVSGNTVAATGVGSATTTAANASYRVNGGTVATSQSNDIMLDNGKLTATLLKTTVDPATLSVKPDTANMVKSLKSLISTYNEFSDSIHEHASLLNRAGIQKFQNAITAFEKMELGISKNNDGSLKLDEEQFKHNIETRFDRMNELISGPRGVAAKLHQAASFFQSTPAEALLNKSYLDFQKFSLYQPSFMQIPQYPMTGLFYNQYF